MERGLQWRAIALMAAAVMAATAIRATGPSDLNEVDQPLQAAYVADILANGHYFVQWDHQGRVATKPPLYNWIAAALIRVAGGPSEFVLKLPSIIAAFGTLILTFLLALRWLDPWAAIAAPLMLASGHHFFKMAYLARTDMLLCFWVVSSIYAFERCRACKGHTGKWNALFWFSQALAVLTKGPAGLALVHVYVLGRLAVDRNMRGYFRLGPLWGIPLMAGVSLAWLLPAIYQGGEPFIERVLKGEILFRLMGTGPRARELQPVYSFFAWFIARFLPWSLLAVAAVLRRGDPSPLRRRSPLMPAALWLGAMLVMLSLIPSKRSDWLMPVYPAGAILAACLFRHISVVGVKASGQVVKYSRALFLILSWLFAVCGLLSLFFLAVSPDLQHLAAPASSILRRASPLISLTAGVLLILSGGMSWIGMRRFRPNMALAGFLAGLLALNLIYYHTITTPAVTHDGDKLKQFMAKAKGMIPPGEKVVFGSTRTPAQFFLLRNQKPAEAEIIIQRVSRGEPFWLLMRLQELQDLTKAYSIEFDIRLVSEYLEYDKARLTLARWAAEKST